MRTLSLYIFRFLQYCSTHLLEVFQLLAEIGFHMPFSDYPMAVNKTDKVKNSLDEIHIGYH